MLAPVLVVLLGIGIGALGLLLPDMYVVGLIVALIGGIGVLVRLVESFRGIRESRH
ncbi:hypothetical protein [Pseudonocardia acidicola]|uniref:Uncharacterized protein n=1 Tax=Pseudonocardia acidicola TaxID=2724939 RepID=A0ABX1SHK7_9PSEU|nr:hypothetical protein [Pseudonocardia acidicola]NMH99963.1 hypothetical protein [Pseudonocardia acidicola]